MADKEHIAILKQGVSAWNQWRREHPEVIPDLSNTNLNRGLVIEGRYSLSVSQEDDELEWKKRGVNINELRIGEFKIIPSHLEHINFNDAKLSSANLEGAQLYRAQISNADLTNATLVRAYLQSADLSRSDISGAKLMNARLLYAKLSDAILWESDLRMADLRGADLSNALMRDADLSHAFLTGANLSGAHLDDTNLAQARIWMTVFGDIDLSVVKNLEKIAYLGPCILSYDTLKKSKGEVPESFLRGCGLSEWEIEAAKLYRSNLSSESIIDILYRIQQLRADQPIQIYPLFIPYSHKDSSFVDRLEEYLNRQGIRFWRDVHNATAGRLERQVDRAIRLNPTVLLILSNNSTQSDWVEHEARFARKLEVETGRDVLCPITLDNSWKSSKWPERLREQIMEYNILDFSGWEERAFFERMFSKLIEGLHIFYK